MVLSASSVVGAAPRGQLVVLLHPPARRRRRRHACCSSSTVARRLPPLAAARGARCYVAVDRRCCVAVLVPGVGVNVNGSSRWLDLGLMQLQPSEFAKLATLLVVADLVRPPPGVGRATPTGCCARRSCWFGVVAVLLMAQPNLGTTLVLGAIVFAVLFCAGVPGPPLARLALRRRRRWRLLATARRPTTGGPGCSPSSTRGPTRRRTGYQTIQSQVSLGVGRLARRRARRGPRQVGLPARGPHRLHLRHHRRGARPDRRLRSSSRCSRARLPRHPRRRRRRPTPSAGCSPPASRRGSACRRFVNIGAVIGILPITGVPLPFVSFGGSSMLANMAAAGILCNVCRNSRSPRPAPSPDAAGRWRDDRSRRGRRRHRRARAAGPRHRPRRSSGAGIGVHFVGAERGIEARLRARRRASTHTLLPGRGIQRRLTLANVGAARRASSAARGQAIGLVRRLRPRVVVGVGGYASFPCVLAAVLWRVPIVVAEQNTHPGAANRLGGPLRQGVRPCRSRARRCPAPSSPATRSGPRSLAVDRARDRRRGHAPRSACPPTGALVLVAGGSLGALSINRRRRRAGRARGATAHDVAVRHVVGDRDWDGVRCDRRRCPPAARSTTPVRYEDRHADRRSPPPTSACSGRARRMCFELAAVGLPAVLVPSPHVTGDHQTANARLARRRRRRRRRARRRARRRPPGRRARRPRSTTPTGAAAMAAALPTVRPPRRRRRASPTSSSEHAR